MLEFEGGMSTNTLYAALESHIQKQRGVKQRNMERIYKSFRKNVDDERHKVLDLMSISLDDLQKIMTDHIDYEEGLFSGVIEDLGFDFEVMFGEGFSYTKVARMITMVEIIEKSLNDYKCDLVKQLEDMLGGPDANIRT